MSDILVLDRVKTKKRAGKVKDVLRMTRGGLWVGDILLDRRGRVWRHVDSIPSDVVLKAMAAFARNEDEGELVGRRDGLSYRWELVKESLKSAASDEETADVGLVLAEAA